MQFMNLNKQYEYLKHDIDSRMQAVFAHGQFILGPEVKILEDHLAQYVGSSYCITVANGTDALLIAMMALNIKPGDEVITSPFTFIANGEMIALLGAKPVFVDIDPSTYNIDPQKIEAAITPKTKCIMPISLYGQCADMHAINSIAKKYDLPVIEDAAQSFGALHKGIKSCNLSTVACTSFFPSKPLGCYGDGGACFTNDENLALKMRQLRVHGQEKRYYHSVLGVNSRLDTLQAAILLSKLTIFDTEIANRQKIGERYQACLKDYVTTMQIYPENSCVYAQFTVALPNREAIKHYLEKCNIPTAIHYPLPLNLQPIFSESHKGLSYPHAEKAAASVLSLPMDAYLSPETQDYVIKNVIDAIANC